MKKTRWKEPYNKAGKTNFPERERPGVYLIKNKISGKIVYVGYSGNNLYRTMYRHFQTWNHSEQPIVTYQAKGPDNYLCRVIYCTAKQAVTLEEMLILKYKPEDNPQKLDFYGSKFTGYQREVLDSYISADIVAPF
jgi:excinuclease UvrABC nuclease subunit